MTAPNSFDDWASALRFKEVVAKVVREEMAKQRPPARYGKVVNFNRFNMTARVVFPGDVETTSVKFPLSLQPTRSVDLGFGDFSDLARVEGIPGNLWITEIVNGPIQQDGSRLNSPSLMGGAFIHEVRARHFTAGTGPLPGQNESWYVGRWKNTASFGSDGAAHLDIVIQQSLLSVVVKHYSLSIRTNDTSGNWRKVAPDRDSGPWAGNDFELEIKCTGDGVEFRVRRTGWNTGFTPAGYDLDVWFYGKEWERDYSLKEAVLPDGPPNRFVGTTSVDGKGPFVSPALAAPTLAQHLLAGGGAVSYSTAFGPILKWTGRFIVMGLGKSHYVPQGFFEIPVPAGGVTIPVYSKSGSVGTTGTLPGGVNLDNWESLYYELPWGGDAAGVEANFRIVKWDGDNFQIPSHWVHVATKHGDLSVFQHVQLGTGEIIDMPKAIGLAAGYGNIGSPWGDAAFRAMQGNRVELEGIVQATAAKAVDTGFATLPVHYRPSTSKMFMVKSSIAAGFTNIVVQSNGVVQHAAALVAGNWFSLDGVSFARSQ